MCVHTHCPGWTKVVGCSDDYVQLRKRSKWTWITECVYTHCPGWTRVIGAPCDYVQLRNFLFEFEVSNPLVVLLLLHCSSVCSDALSWMYEGRKFISCVLLCASLQSIVSGSSVTHASNPHTGGRKNASVKMSVEVLPGAREHRLHHFITWRQKQEEEAYFLTVSANLEPIKSMLTLCWKTVNELKLVEQTAIPSKTPRPECMRIPRVLWRRAGHWNLSGGMSALSATSWAPMNPTIGSSRYVPHANLCPTQELLLKCSQCTRNG